MTMMKWIIWILNWTEEYDSCDDKSDNDDEMYDMDGHCRPDYDYRRNLYAPSILSDKDKNESRKI